MNSLSFNSQIIEKWEVYIFLGLGEAPSSAPSRDSIFYPNISHLKLSTERETHLICLDTILQVSRSLIFPWVSSLMKFRIKSSYYQILLFSSISERFLSVLKYRIFFQRWRTPTIFTIREFQNLWLIYPFIESCPNI